MCLLGSLSIASGFAYLPRWEKTGKSAQDFFFIDIVFKLWNHWTVPFLCIPCFKLVSLEDGIHSSGVSGVRKWCFLAICTGRFFEYVAMTFFLVVPNSVQSLLLGALDLPVV